MSARRERVLSPKKAWAVVAAAVVFATAISGIPRGDRASAQQATQSRPFLALLCAYADVPSTYGISADLVQSMFVGGYAGLPDSMNDYIREMSYGAYDLAGSRAAGWYRLPGTMASYQASFGVDFGRIAADCTTAAAAGGTDVSQWNNFAFFLNDNMNGVGGFCCGGELTVNGQAKAARAVWFHYRALTSPRLVLHEIGHYFGADHTQSQTDPLGNSQYGTDLKRPVWRPGYQFPGTQLTPNLIGGGYDANNRDKMRWIPANRKARFAGGTQSFTLARLTQPGSDGNLLVEVQFGTLGAKYVVSARTRIGYDAKSDRPIHPSIATDYYVEPGVHIQRVTGTSDPTVVLSTPGGNPATTDGVWKQGQSYADPANGLTITVDRFDDNGAQITVTGTATATTAPATTAPATTAPATTAAPVTTAPPANSTPATTAPAATTGGGALPQNDLAAAPLVAPAGRYGPVATGTANLETGEPQPCGAIGNTMWLRFTADASRTYTIHTIGADYDTVLSVYRSTGTANGFASLTNLACNDDVNGTAQSGVTVTVAAGDTVYLQVGGYRNASGSAVVTVS